MRSPLRRSASRFRSLIAAAVMVVLSNGAGASRAQTLDTTLWVPNAEVKSILRVGNTLYLGGNFTEIGPPTGNGVGIQYPSGAVVPGFPKVTGYVTCVAPDGDGGWYIGGTFTRVNGIARSCAAHIRADFTVSGWNPYVTSTGALRVNSILVHGGRVYLGGFFTSVGGQARASLAAVDRVNGNPTSWNPNPNTEVNSLAASGANIVAGGRFTTIGGQARNRIAQVDTTNGLANAWNPNANLDVAGVVVSGTTVYAYGDFSTIGGQTRPQLAALDVITGTATAWNPRPLAKVRALVVRNGIVYVGGDFTSFFSGATRNYLAAIDAATGTVRTWNPNVGNWPLSSPRVYSLAFNGAHLLVGGAFTTIGGQTRTCLAEVDTATALARAWDPHVGSEVLALAANGSTVFAGGYFQSVGGVTRLRGAALDATMGAAIAWNPNANGALLGLAEQSGTIYTIGEFSNIGGAGRFQIAALDGVTGAPTSWNPQAFGGGAFLYSIAATPSAVFIGGDYSFTFGGGASRTDLAALDRTTAVPIPWWDPRPVDGPNNAVWSIVPQGDQIFVGGSFNYIGGLPWQNLVQLDSLTSQTRYAWNPAPDALVASVALGGGLAYAAGGFSAIGGQPRAGLAAVDPVTGLATAWNPAVTGPVARLDNGNGLVFLVGQMSQVGAQPSKGASAVDMVTGLPASWMPDPAGSGQFTCVEAYDRVVYLGGSFSQLDGRPIGGLAAYNFPPSTASTPHSPHWPVALEASPNPFPERVSVRFVLPETQSVRMEVLDIAGRRVWRSPDERLAAGIQTLAWDGSLEGSHAHADAGIYFVRVLGDRFSVSRRVVRVR
jgi:trimeric autotransporter adhesin